MGCLRDILSAHLMAKGQGSGRQQRDGVAPRPSTWADGRRLPDCYTKLAGQCQYTSF